MRFEEYVYTGRLSIGAGIIGDSGRVLNTATQEEERKGRYMLQNKPHIDTTVEEIVTHSPVGARIHKLTHVIRFSPQICRAVVAA